MAPEAIIQEYVEEVKEHLQELEQCLLSMEREGASPEGIGEIFRAAHSIKGAASYMGFEQMANLTHGLESIIGKIQTGSRPVGPRGVSALLECVDIITHSLGHLQETGNEPPLPDGFLDTLVEVFEDLEGEGPTDGKPFFLESEELDPLERDFSFEDDQDSLRGEETFEELFSFAEDDETETDEAIIEEEDQELFGIFSESFLENLSALEELLAAGEDRPLSQDGFERGLTKLKNLISSSQYMDYGRIVDRLSSWEESFVKAHRDGRTTGHSHLDSLSVLKKQLHAALPALMPVKAAAGPDRSESSDSEVIREEDQELFAIFLDAFRQHLVDLMQITPVTPEDDVVPEDAGRACEALRKLTSSARYMDYDKIVGLLTQWEESLRKATRTGDLDGRLYWGLFNHYGQRFQKILPGLEEVFSPENFPANFLSGGTVPQGGHDRAEEGRNVDGLEEEARFDPFAHGKALTTAGTKGSGSGPAQQPEKIVAKPVRASSAAVADETSAVTLRVDAPKVDQLLNQVGELVVIRSEFIQTVQSFREMLRELVSQGRLSKQEIKRLRSLSFRLNESTQSLGRVSNDLQDSVMRIRMLPISQLFRRFPRVVRDQALKLGKSVELVLEGGETEIDKRVLEQMHDPLVQFLRNAIAHGIESPRERGRANKPETGMIRLAAYHEGDYVTLEIEDDGRGIDLSKLKQVLESRNELGPHEIERLTDEELIYAVFLPGVSTRDHVDGSAGRGVGLDVVKENVERMNGTVEVESHPGSGTRFLVRIPLTVAIIRALLLRGGDQVFTLPLSSVTEILRYRHESAFTIEGFQVISLRGKTIPLVHLSELLNRPTDRSDNGHKFIVIVTTSFREVGLVVDGLIGEREVVMKPIEDDFHSFKGFSGATILGDGRISLILDVSSLLRAVREGAASRASGQESSFH